MNKSTVNHLKHRMACYRTSPLPGKKLPRLDLNPASMNCTCFLIYLFIYLFISRVYKGHVKVPFVETINHSMKVSYLVQYNYEYIFSVNHLEHTLRCNFKPLEYCKGP